MFKSGKEIGVARVYDFVLETGSYEVANKPLNQWDLTLFDVQTYTDLEVNTNTTLTIPTFIEGESSGATWISQIRCICWNCIYCI